MAIPFLPAILGALKTGGSFLASKAAPALFRAGRGVASNPGNFINATQILGENNNEPSSGGFSSGIIGKAIKGLLGGLGGGGDSTSSIVGGAKETTGANQSFMPPSLIGFKQNPSILTALTKMLQQSRGF